MNKLLVVVLFCLALMGCGQKAVNTLPDRLTPTKETENDMLRCYPLDGAECRFFALGGDLYLLRSQGTDTTLLRYTGKLLVQTASLALGDAVVQPLADGFGCYDSKRQELILLNHDLEEHTRISLPKCTQPPILNASGTQVYYVTDAGLVEGDLETGIHRLFRQMPTRKITLTAWMETSGTLLCQGQKTDYFSTADGTMLGSSPQVLAACTIGSRDCLALHCGYNDCLYLGSNLLPLVPGMHFLDFLPSLHCALIYEHGEPLRFSLYDVGTGNLAARISISGKGTPIQAAASDDGRVFLLLQEDDRFTLYQWLGKTQTRQDAAVRLCPVFTNENPSQKGLEQCRQKAAFLEEKYGIRILLHTDAIQNTPGNYTLEAEHIPAILLDTLDRIERALLRLPTGFVRETVQENTNVCLVRTICSAAETLPYLQYWQGTDSYLYIAASEDAGDAVLRALSPMIDQRIITCCDAYDTWEALNPSGFVYGQTPEEFSAFADPIAVASPREDRASLLLAAITRDNRTLFHSAILQKKLRRMCQGIRAAYSSSQSSPPWEQYLWEPIV